MQGMNDMSHVFDYMDSLPSRQDMVKVIRLTNNVFFGNVEALKETIFQFIPVGESNLRAIVVDTAGVSHADLSGLQALDELHGMVMMTTTHTYTHPPI